MSVFLPTESWSDRDISRFGSIDQARGFLAASDSYKALQEKLTDLEAHIWALIQLLDWAPSVPKWPRQPSFLHNIATIDSDECPPDQKVALTVLSDVLVAMEDFEAEHLRYDGYWRVARIQLLQEIQDALHQDLSKQFEQVASLQGWVRQKIKDILTGVGEWKRYFSALLAKPPRSSDDA